MTVIHLLGEFNALHTLAEVHRIPMVLNGPLLAVRGHEQAEPKGPIEQAREQVHLEANAKWT